MSFSNFGYPVSERAEKMHVAPSILDSRGVDFEYDGEMTADVALNPRELGRVRMSISAAEAGITVTVLAERPETLDLMRRNIDELAREFQNIGYESINFAFAEGDTRQHQGSPDSEAPTPVPPTITIEEIETADGGRPAQTVSSGVDLRL